MKQTKSITVTRRMTIPQTVASAFQMVALSLKSEDTNKGYFKSYSLAFQSENLKERYFIEGLSTDFNMKQTGGLFI